ncbi:MAG TPA: DUF6600 domain-containing protein, partial [Vicinamibacteria bacterium]|nr:DUF6600 domain-containing protein [Vicinamibacteria bacterium]
SWYFVAEVGHVWRPYVASGWQPYSSGRWVWTYYGWTWVPTEPWGWAVSHYGRWDYAYGVGWYWIPGRVWGPGWVSWAVGGDYVGWCPLGYRDRPVTLGRAVTRGSLASHGTSSAWTYMRRADLGAGDVARRRVELGPEQVRALKVAEMAQARPSRDARTIEVRTAVPRDGGVPRSTRSRMSPGDTVPELAVDNRTTIPAPSVRRPRPRQDEERRETPETPARSVGRDAPAGEPERPEVRAPRPSWSRRDDSTAGREAAPRARETSPRDRESDRYRDRDDGTRGGPGAAPRSRDTDSDRDVLRRMFRPLAERPTPERSASPRSEPRSEPQKAPRGETRTAPRTETSRPASPPAPRPAKDRDNR